jgi:flagellar protein FliL
MMRKLIPVLLALLGLGGGVGAGLALKPAAPAEVDTLETGNPCGDLSSATAEQRASTGPAPELQEYVKLNNQFIVPVVLNERVNALVVLSLSVGVTKGQSGMVFDREPKLRDAFLQVLFNHGSFTESTNMAVLRRALNEAGRAVLGEMMGDVLITDLARQDV